MVFYLVMCILWFIVCLMQVVVAWFAWVFWHLVGCFGINRGSNFFGRKLEVAGVLVPAKKSFTISLCTALSTRELSLLSFTLVTVNVNRFG